MERPLPFAVLISGRGSNMLALAQGASDGAIAGRVTLVISDRADAAGLVAAARRGLATRLIEPLRGVERAAFGLTLSDAIEQSGAELVALAGFMRILDAGFVQRWRGRLLNIHPSLLGASWLAHPPPRPRGGRPPARLHRALRDRGTRCRPGGHSGAAPGSRRGNRGVAFSARSAAGAHHLSACGWLVRRRAADVEG